MDYEKLIWRLKLTNEPLAIKAADTIKRLLENNKLLREGYNVMFRDLQREIDKRSKKGE